MLDLKVLREQLAEAAEKIIALPRYPRGYDGYVTVEDVIVVVAVRCEDGRIRYVDPAEVSDSQPDCFVRDYVRVPNGRTPVSVIGLLERFLPVVFPKAGWLNSLTKWWR